MLNDIRAIGMENGADDFVTKPFSPRELVHVLRLRKSLREAGSLVKTVRGHGYKLSAGEAA